jgi:serine/threonine protein kinase
VSRGKPTGRWRGSERRDDDAAVRIIAEITELSDVAVADALRSARGNAHVRTVFHDRWPWSASRLAGRTTAFARDVGLHAEIAWATGASRTLITRRLNSGPGKRLLRNLFWDHWPELDAEAPAPADETIAVSRTISEERDTEPPPPDESPRETGPGTLLSGRYELRTRLGSGGFGTTYEAYDRLSELDLVVKIPHADDGGAIRRELRQAFRLIHPNICQAFPERDDDTGQPFLVMQHGGEDLASRLARHGDEPYPVALAVHVLVSVADALDYLHARLELHLDVSPKNILIDEDDVVRLTDFGASARACPHVDTRGSHTMLATSVSQLSPNYAAPELAHGEGRSASDQYSLALVFCTLIEGRLFRSRYRFAAHSSLSSVQNVAIEKALSHHPEDRFDSCGEFARAVATAMGGISREVIATDLNRLSRDLLQRLGREIERTGSATSRVGGVVQVGRAVERLLHGVVLWMGAAGSFDPEEELRLIDPRTPSLSRATAGRIARTIMARATDASAQRPEVASIVADLTLPESRIWRLINYRNEIVHGVRQPEELVPAARGLALLVREYRRSATWL